MDQRGSKKNGPGQSGLQDRGVDHALWSFQFIFYFLPFYHSFLLYFNLSLSPLVIVHADLHYIRRFPSAHPGQGTAGGYCILSWHRQVSGSFSLESLFHVKRVTTALVDIYRYTHIYIITVCSHKSRLCAYTVVTQSVLFQDRNPGAFPWSSQIHTGFSGQYYTSPSADRRQLTCMSSD